MFSKSAPGDFLYVEKGYWGTHIYITVNFQNGSLVRGMAWHRSLNIEFWVPHVFMEAIVIIACNYSFIFG